MPEALLPDGGETSAEPGPSLDDGNGGDDAPAPPNEPDDQGLQEQAPPSSEPEDQDPQDINDAVEQPGDSPAGAAEPSPEERPGTTPASRRAARELETYNKDSKPAEKIYGRTRQENRRLKGGASMTAAICNVTRVAVNTSLADSCGDEPVRLCSLHRLPTALSAQREWERPRDSVNAQDYIETQKMGLHHLNFPPSSTDPEPIGHISEIGSEPQSVNDVRGADHEELWRDAMARELHGLVANQTFSPVSKPPDRKAIGGKWVFKWKTDKSGNVVKAKARLVAKGFSQQEGVDYFDTFAPTPSTSSIRLVVAVAVENDLDLNHFDAEQAFVQSKLDTDIYLKMPPGCGELSGRTVLLNKSLYGLKQAARTWHDLLIDTLKSIGFQKHPSEPCVLRLLDPESGAVRLMIAVHVDDMVVAGNDDDCDWLRRSLSRVFPVNNLGPLTWYTGCAFERDRDNGTMKIHQTAFVDSMMERFLVTSIKSIPADPSIDLRGRTQDDDRAKAEYRQAVGCLMWQQT